MHSVTAHLGHDRLFVSAVCDNVSGRCHGLRTDLAPLPDCRGRPERGVPRCGQREGRRSGAGRTAEELPGHRAQAEAGKRRRIYSEGVPMTIKNFKWKRISF